MKKHEPSGGSPVPPQVSSLPPETVAGRVLSGDQRTARVVGPVFIVFAALLVVWIAILAVTLPERGILHNEDLVWVGFDIGLLAGLSWTAWAALRRHSSLPLAAAATGASLITDAWFDVVGSDGHDRTAAIAMAILVELPLSAFCWWLAIHSQELATRRVSRMVTWWQQAEGAGPPPAPPPRPAPAVPSEVSDRPADEATTAEPSDEGSH